MNSTNPIPLESDFNWWWYKAKNNYLKELTKLYVPKNNNLNILEIGPGLGNNLSNLNQFGVVDILEVEKEFINYNMEKNRKLIRNIFTSLDSVDLKYDLVILLDVLEHIKDTDKFLGKIKKICKDGSYLIVSTPAFMSLWSNHDISLNHFRRYTLRTLKEDLSPWFKIKKFYGMNYTLLPVRYFQIKFLKSPNTLKESDLINNVLYLISLVEYFLLKLKINIPWGISIFTICQNE